MFCVAHEKKAFFLRRNKCVVIQARRGVGYFGSGFFAHWINISCTVEDLLLKDLKLKHLNCWEMKGRGTRAHGNLTIRFALLRRKEWLFFIKRLSRWQAACVQIQNISYLLDTILASTTDFFLSLNPIKYCIFTWKLLHKAKISLHTCVLLEGRLNAAQLKWHWVILEGMNRWWFKCPSGTWMPTFWLMSLSWVKII